MRTLVLGIGNPILGDDGVGIHVARELAKKIEDENIVVKEASTGGLNLLEMLIGYDKAVIVDAIQTEEGEPGRIYQLPPGEFAETIHSASPHDTNFAAAIGIGHQIAPTEIPKEIVIFAIEVEEITEFTEEMTEKVKAAIPGVVHLVLEELGEGGEQKIGASSAEWIMTGISV